MRLCGEWWCPDILGGPGKYLKKTPIIDMAVKRLTQRRRVIEAGGHIGIWPVLLSKHFENVVTFEPEPDNYKCLMQNITRTHNVVAFNAALTDNHGPVTMAFKPKSTATHHVSVSAAGTQVCGMTIDECGYADVDAIFLDIEGYEVFALYGAKETIRTQRPLLVVENTAYLNRYNSAKALVQFLEAYGYEKVGGFDVDEIWEYRRA